MTLIKKVRNKHWKGVIIWNFFLEYYKSGRTILNISNSLYRLIIIGPAAPVQVTISPIAAVTAEEEVASVVSVATTPVVVPQVSLDPALWIRL